MSPKEYFDLITQGGLLGAVSLALWAMYTERVVPKARMEELKLRLQQALDGWRESTEALEKNTEALNVLTKTLEERLDRIPVPRTRVRLRP